MNFVFYTWHMHALTKDSPVTQFYQKLPMNDLDKMMHLDLHLATKAVCVYVSWQFTASRWGVTHLYQNQSYILVVLNLSTPEIIGIYTSMMMSG